MGEKGRRFEITNRGNMPRDWANFEHDMFHSSSATARISPNKPLSNIKEDFYEQIKSMGA